METKPKAKIQNENQVTVEEINRVLEGGRFLFSVLTPEEIAELKDFLLLRNQIGNAGDSWRARQCELRFSFNYLLEIFLGC